MTDRSRSNGKAGFGRVGAIDNPPGAAFQDDSEPEEDEEDEEDNHI